jgi:hypothetical protein
MPTHVLTTDEYIGIIQYPSATWKRYEDIPSDVRHELELARFNDKQLLLIISSSHVFASSINHCDCVVRLRERTSEAVVVKDRSGILPREVYLSPGLYMQARRMADLIP